MQRLAAVAHVVVAHLALDAAWVEASSAADTSAPSDFVERKMSNYNVRHRGEALHQKHQPVPVLRI